MAPTYVSTFAVTLASASLTWLGAQALALASPGAPVAISEPGLVHAKQSVPDDPLAGLPSDERSERRPGKRHSGKALCAINAAPSSDREIGDLRAALAFLKLGPTGWICRDRSDTEIRLRIGIDATGKITAVERVEGDAGVSNTMAKMLLGKAVGPRAENPTVGIVVLKLTSGKP
jgi:hypothetical protein